MKTAAAADIHLHFYSSRKFFLLCAAFSNYLLSFIHFQFFSIAGKFITGETTQIIIIDLIHSIFFEAFIFSAMNRASEWVKKGFMQAKIHLNWTMWNERMEFSCFLCCFSSSTFFPLFSLHIFILAAGHLHASKLELPMSLLTDFSVIFDFYFYASFNIQRIWVKKTHARARAHSRQSNWRLKIKSYNEYMRLVLKFDWKWVD